MRFWKSETQICRCKKNALFCFGILTITFTKNTSVASFFCGYCLFQDCQCDQYHTCAASCSVHLKTWFPFLIWTSPELSLIHTDHPQVHSRYAWGGEGFFMATILQVKVPNLQCFEKLSSEPYMDVLSQTLILVIDSTVHLNTTVKVFFSAYSQVTFM